MDKNPEKIAEGKATGRDDSPSDDSPHVRIIKKYPNRRLYDTGESRYITLEDLAVLIRQDVEVRVIDAKSGDDLTRSTLTQIIFEHEGRPSSLLPTEFLRQLICFYGRNTPTFLSNYLQEAITHFAHHQEDMQRLMSQGGFWSMHDLSAMNQKQMAFVRDSMRFFLPGGHTASTRPPSEGGDSAPGDDSADRIRALEERIEELQLQLQRATADD